MYKDVIRDLKYYGIGRLHLQPVAEDNLSPYRNELIIVIKTYHDETIYIQVFLLSVFLNVQSIKYVTYVVLLYVRLPRSIKFFIADLSDLIIPTFSVTIES